MIKINLFVFYNTCNFNTNENFYVIDLSTNIKYNINSAPINLWHKDVIEFCYQNNNLIVSVE